MCASGDGKEAREVYHFMIRVTPGSMHIFWHKNFWAIKLIYHKIGNRYQVYLVKMDVEKVFRTLQDSQQDAHNATIIWQCAALTVNVHGT